MHMGQIIQEPRHALLRTGRAGTCCWEFDSAPETRNVVGLIGANPALTVKAVQLRKFGQEIIQTLAGRRIHPNFAVPAGQQSPANEQRDGILKGVDAAVETLKTGPADHEKTGRKRNVEDINKSQSSRPVYFRDGHSSNGLELYNGDIRLIDRGRKELERFGRRELSGLYFEHGGTLVIPKVPLL